MNRHVLFHSCVAFVFLLPAFAARPTLTPQERDERAEVVVTGRVVGTRVMTLRKPTSTVTFVRLKAEVESTEKGADLVAGDRYLDIRCRKIDLYDGDGATGHREIPAEGSRFRMWLRKNPDVPDQPQWEPLEPNGIELLDGTAAMVFRDTTESRSMRNFAIGGLVGIVTFVALAIFLWRRRTVR